MNAVFTVPTSQQAQMIARQLMLSGNAVADQLQKTYIQMYEQLWSSPDPAAVIASMDTNAAKFFQLSIAMFDVLTAAGVSGLPTRPEGWSVTMNADGSVVLSKA